MKTALKIAIPILGIAAILLSQSMTWELNLQTGVAKASYAIAGVTYSEATNMTNPNTCPTWTRPNSHTKKETISYTCYTYLSRFGQCKSDVIAYQRAYNKGCGLK